MDFNYVPVNRRSLTDIVQKIKYRCPTSTIVRR